MCHEVSADSNTKFWFHQDYAQDSSQRLCTVTKRHLLGDGICDNTKDEPGYNTKRCGWDGGDCCRMTCLARGNPFLSCRQFQCLDPQLRVLTDALLCLQSIRNCFDEYYVTCHRWCLFFYSSPPDQDLPQVQVDVALGADHSVGPEPEHESGYPEPGKPQCWVKCRHCPERRRHSHCHHRRPCRSHRHRCHQRRGCDLVSVFRSPSR